MGRARGEVALRLVEHLQRHVTVAKQHVGGYPTQGDCERNLNGIRLGEVLICLVKRGQGFGGLIQTQVAISKNRSDLRRLTMQAGAAEPGACTLE